MVVKKRLTTVLKEELERMQLRPADRGIIKGEFEEHFFGKGVELPKDVIITQELCKKWYLKVTRLARERKLDADQVSEDLDNLFQSFFNATLPKGRHVTVRLCDDWRKKHLNFLIEIWQKRIHSGGVWMERSSENDSR